MLFGHPTQIERPYPGCSFVARIDFPYGEHQFKKDDDFDHVALGLTEAQTSDLWVAGRLLVKPKAAPAPAETHKKRKAG